MAKVKDKNGDQILTVKQSAFFKYIALGFSRSEAAKKAGYKCPRVSASTNITNYTSVFREAFAEAGYSIAEIIQDVLRGKEAMKESFDERTGEWKPVPDWGSRYKFIDTAIELQGLYAPTKQEITGENGGPIITQEKKGAIISALYDLKVVMDKLGG